MGFDFQSGKVNGTGIFCWKKMQRTWKYLGPMPLVPSRNAGNVYSDVL